MFVMIVICCIFFSCITARVGVWRCSDVINHFDVHTIWDRLRTYTNTLKYTTMITYLHVKIISDVKQVLFFYFLTLVF